MANSKEFDDFIAEVKKVPRADMKDALANPSEAEQTLRGSSVASDGLYKMAEYAQEYARLKDQLLREQGDG